jgi:predicted nucleic acid-binding protein
MKAVYSEYLKVWIPPPSTSLPRFRTLARGELQEMIAAKVALDADLADATVIAMTDEVLLGCVEMLESHALRSADAIQISSALVWQAGVFVSADEGQCSAARASGLDVIRL